MSVPQDPQLDQLKNVFEAWVALWGNDIVTVNAIVVRLQIEKASTSTSRKLLRNLMPFLNGSDPHDPGFSISLGRFLSRVSDKNISGYQLCKSGISHHAVTWRVFGGKTQNIPKFPSVIKMGIIS